ncbi:MAG: hypothetical protein AAGC68_08230 [Verrucomicrobiota bacterium]
MRKLFTIPALIAAFLSMDLHWSVMQTVTWVAMIQESGEQATLGEKVIATITGQDPCLHCDALAEQRQSERDEPFSLFGNGPQLAPIVLSQSTISHCRHALFALGSTPIPLDSWISPGIERPPCV